MDSHHKSLVCPLIAENFLGHQRILAYIRRKISMIYHENTTYYENTLMTYVRKKKEISFEEEAFNEVDALLLCQMIYPKVEYYLPKLNANPSHAARKISWMELDRPERRKRLFGASIYGSMYADLFDEIKESRRYGQIRLGLMKAMTDREKKVQFAAMTAWIDEKNAFVIFRGTDSSLIGWKENFRYAYLRKWPAHKLAREYLLKVAPYVEGRLSVGGHSKGGNLAVYASARVPQKIQRRIERIYSFDGMGFRSSFYQTTRYQEIRKKIFKLVPEESLIGMLFAPEEGFHIVQSYEHGFLQHDLMNWKIVDDHFLLKEDFSKKHHRLINRLNLWLRSLSGREKKEFSELLFQFFGDLLVGKDGQSITDGKILGQKMSSALKAMTKQERRLFLHGLLRLAHPERCPTMG